MRKSNFGTGLIQGTFKCVACEKLTRETPETCGTKLCSVCYRFFQTDNQFMDGEISEEEFLEAEKEYQAYRNSLKREITKKMKIEITNVADDWEWEDMLEELRWLGLDQGYFEVHGQNIGWRNLSGSKIFECDSVIEFLEGVIGFSRGIGATTWALRLKIKDSDFIFDDPENPKTAKMTIEKLSGILSHYDSPCGESQNITRLTWEEYYNHELCEVI